MPRKFRGFNLSDEVIAKLDAIAARMPPSRHKLPATRTDALVKAVDEYDGWISVEDALPMPGEDVLVWGEDEYNCVFGETGSWYMEIADLTRPGEKPPYWWSDLRVTHWQPLPGPPTSPTFRPAT